MKILLAEDTKDLNRALMTVFSHEGYEVDTAFDGETAYDLLMKTHYDCIVLDIMMPKKDGLSVLRDLRAMKIDSPVLLLTAKAEVDDRVSGLDQGADDYLTKPFALKELLARVRALTRRHIETTDKILHFGDIVLNEETLELSASNSVRISAKEYDLLSLLIQNSDRELDSEYLGAHVWDRDPNTTKEEVWLYISYLKGKLSSVGSTVSISGSIGGSYRLIQS